MKKVAKINRADDPPGVVPCLVGTTVEMILPSQSRQSGLSAGERRSATELQCGHARHLGTNMPISASSSMNPNRDAMVCPRASVDVYRHADARRNFQDCSEEQRKTEMQLHSDKMLD